jgi:hypothetical protein
MIAAQNPQDPSPPEEPLGAAVVNDAALLTYDPPFVIGVYSETGETLGVSDSEPQGSLRVRALGLSLCCVCVCKAI